MTQILKVGVEEMPEQNQDQDHSVVNTPSEMRLQVAESHGHRTL